jgi:hypothetical protein
VGKVVWVVDDPTIRKLADVRIMFVTASAQRERLVSA